MAEPRIEYALKNLGKVPDYFYRQIFRFFGHRNYKKFIVLSRARSGSTFLISLLHSHPNIYAKAEIFSHLKGRPYQKILNSMYRKQPPYVKAVGFKIFYRQPWDTQDTSIWDKLIDTEDIAVIHLKRRNMLRVFLSGAIAQKTQMWQATKSQDLLDVQSRQVELDFGHLKSKFETMKDFREAFDHKFRYHPIISVYYEDLSQHPQREFKRITDLLEIPFHAPKTRFIRQNPETPAQLITNYAQLKQQFLGTEWESFFDE